MAFHQYGCPKKDAAKCPETLRRAAFGGVEGEVKRTDFTAKIN